MSSARKIRRHSSDSMSQTFCFFVTYDKCKFRFLVFPVPETMEKDPLRGNASIPMSFPASYQAVGDQVMRSTLKPVRRFEGQWVFIAS